MRWNGASKHNETLVYTMEPYNDDPIPDVSNELKCFTLLIFEMIIVALLFLPKFNVLRRDEV